MSENKRFRITGIVVIAVVVLALLSVLPLEEWTNGKISDFSLISDIIKTKSSAVDSDSIVSQAIVDDKIADTRQVDTSVIAYDNTPVLCVQPNKQDGNIIIEDYTIEGTGLVHLKDALNSKRMARIAVVGDSYIEGDIFTADLREALQTKYGGRGVGYVNMHSEFPGFRRSVRQSGGDGWKSFAANERHDKQYMGLMQHYFKSTGATTSKYVGSSSYKNVDSWNVSKFVFYSPGDTKLFIETDAGVDTINVVGKPEMQCVTKSGSTTKFIVKSSAPGLIGLGVWLTDNQGVNVDCMSSRGFSGTTLASVDANLTNELSKYVPYDLIVLEFGVNAISPNQTNFDSYQSKMENVIAHIKQLYPNSDILIMGVGDRGKKSNGEIHSMNSVPYMVKAQRDMARKQRCLFWDTREAMGGEDAIVEWNRNGWANADYVHLNHKGGKELGSRLATAIITNLDQ